MPEYDVDQLLEEWRINGLVVFESLIPEETVDKIREAWVPLRQAGVREQGPEPVRGTGRYNVRVPFHRPFVDPDIFEHPSLVAFLEGALGEDYVWNHFDSNIPIETCRDYQQWHRDTQIPFPGLMTPSYTVGVKFPLVDTDEQNGSIEVLPGTQFVSDTDLQSDLDRVFGKGDARRGHYSSIRLNLKKGSLWIHDARIFHRGTPNLSDVPRDELCMAMSRPWLFNKWQYEHTEPHFPRDLWESLSDHAKQVLRRQRVKDR
tara:strand:+ start:3061 stop:3840 length:780 start_codon:yes stop_codon:yes gene_type:complete